MSALSLRCPSCGEDERLRGSRQGDLSVVRCEACGHEWLRDPRRAHTAGAVPSSTGESTDPEGARHATVDHRLPDRARVHGVWKRVVT
jgi:uncharacterized Zn finger protein